MTRQFPFRVAVAYAVFAALWIAGSDWLIVHVFPDRLAVAMTGKGWAFVGVTTALLFVVLHREMRHRQSVERDLAASEMRLRTTFEQAAIGIAHAAPDGRFLRVNPGLTAMTGYAAAELLRRRFQDITHPDDVAEDQRQLEDLLAGRATRYVREKRYVRKDGSILWGAINVALVRDALGRPDYCIATIDDISLRKQAEAVLERERQFIQALLHSISDGVVACDAAGNITLLNQALRDLHGGEEPAETALEAARTGRLFADLRPAVDRDDLPLYRALRGERVRNVEFQAGPDGRSPRSVLVNAEPVLGADGRSLGAVAVVRDITERVKAEASLRDSEAHLRAVLDNAPASIVLKDLDGRFLIANQVFLDRYHLTAEQAVGRTSADVNSPGVAEETAVQERMVLAEGRAMAFEAERDHEGRGPRTYINFRFPVMAADGRPLGVGTINVDITDRKRAEQALAASERRLALALEATNDGLWDWNLATGRIFCSERYKAILGYGPGEFPDSYAAIREMIHADDRPRVERVIDELQSSSRDRFEEEFRMRHRDGHHVDIVSRGYLMRDDTGKGVRMTGTHTDVTELRAVQAQLAQAYKLRAVGQLAGGTAHDFNNLLQVIQSSLDLVRRRMAPDHEVARYLDSALRATERGGRLTQQLLSFSRKQVLRPETVCLAELIRGMLDLIRRTLGEDIEIRCELADGLPPVTVDPHAMENAILNVALNARAAMPGGGTLTVRAGRRRLDKDLQAGDGTLSAGDYVEIALADTGCGMTAEVAEHAFEPFFTTKEVGQGSGLGLSMVFGFTRQSGGHVLLDSTVGRGTTVTLLLPVARSKE